MHAEQEQFVQLPGMGNKFKVCSMRCVNEMEWLQTLSIIRADYYPDPRKYDEDGYEIKDKDNSKSSK
jgi:hypothetical protein